MARNFITNAVGQNSLKGRIQTLIQHSRELKFLVGFFYFSGWKELYEALRGRNNLDLKILVGMDIDLYLGRVLEVADPTAGNSTQQEIVSRFFTSLRLGLRDEALDTEEFYQQVTFFVHLLEEGRLQIRKTLDPNHAKLYLFRLDEAGQLLVDAPGRFITGSSNLTRAGLLGQQEFNVEIGDYGWEDAEGYFDGLWDAAIPLSESAERREEILRIIRRQTPAAKITPFEAYALVLKAYLDLMEQKHLRPQTKDIMKESGYKLYRYQEEAVQQALTVLEEYGGVILADVVGLGKSVIASWLARERGGRGLVICPPALAGDPHSKDTGWYKYISDFKLHGWDVYSLGVLDQVQEYLSRYGQDVTTIVVDEAHRFRNEDTEAYERLSQICANRGVILLTATPFNNAPADIFSLLKLFIPPGKSTLTLDEKLSARFAHYNSTFRKLTYILRYHRAGGAKQARAEKYYTDFFAHPLPINIVRTRQRVQEMAEEIRAVLEPIVIRRNRLDLKCDPVYAQEITGLSKVADPVELFYELTPAQSDFYNRVINEYFGEEGRFKGAIYQPYAYEYYAKLAVLEEEGNFSYLQQRNLYEFMRRLLVKRFESSFGSFAKSVDNFIDIHTIVLAFIERTGRYILDRNLIERIWAEDDDTIAQALQLFAESLSAEEDLAPHQDHIYEVAKFDAPEEFLRDIRSDLELFREIAQRVEELKLTTEDPKSSHLVRAIREIFATLPGAGEPRPKVIVFSEYQDTLRHIGPVLQAAFPGRVLVAEGSLGKGFFSNLFANFDAGHPAEKQCDKFDILVATDRLSEGINLNRAGIVINYDIPWNPTRVIQRLGRINRIGQRIFATLYIYNFFPTEQGAEIVKSREIAAQKMFLIHNTLGEDAKIFAPEETPSPAELFKHINRNPEEEGEESLLTSIRKEFYTIGEQYPDLVRGLEGFSARVKTAKADLHNRLLVFRRKGLQLFIHTVPDTSSGKLDVHNIILEKALPLIRSSPETPREPLSPFFWPAYRAIKGHREHISMPLSERSLLVRAENNLRSAGKNHAADLAEYLSFIQTLLRDLKEYQTLPKYTLRRLTVEEMDGQASPGQLSRFRAELDLLRRTLGDDYLDRLAARIKDVRSEIIIAVENRSGSAGPG